MFAYSRNFCATVSPGAAFWVAELCVAKGDVASVPEEDGKADESEIDMTISESDLSKRAKAMPSATRLKHAVLQRSGRAPNRQELPDHARARKICREEGSMVAQTMKYNLSST
jgi:hypothetical protein